MKIISIVGARPNFMKIAPIIEEFKKFPKIDSILVHTGQHYDNNMSNLFFTELNLPKPDIYLGVGSGTHAEQTAKIMIAYEKILLKEKPDLTVVVGDVNSTIACALASVKVGVPVAHVEAGLRSFDRSMPEEINRMLTDAISNYLFITERSAKYNLIKEGKSSKNIYFVGNVMIDSLLKSKEQANKSNILKRLKLESKEYALLTLHRPSNVDDKKTFVNILKALDRIRKSIKIVCPIHPRTIKIIHKYNLHKKYSFLDNNNQDSFIVTEPLGYLDFIKLMNEAKFVLTDSGGIQEETTVLGVPCITLRNNTERPVTVEDGTNILVGTKKENIINAVIDINKWFHRRKKKIPPKWDGCAAKRIVEILVKKQEKIVKDN